MIAAREKSPASPQLPSPRRQVGRMRSWSQARSAASSAAVRTPDGRMRSAAKTNPGTTRATISDVWQPPSVGQALTSSVVVLTQAMDVGPRALRVAHVAADGVGQAQAVGGRRVVDERSLGPRDVEVRHRMRRRGGRPRRRPAAPPSPSPTARALRGLGGPVGQVGRQHEVADGGASRARAARASARPSARARPMAPGGPGGQPAADQGDAGEDDRGRRDDAGRGVAGVVGGLVHRRSAACHQGRIALARPRHARRRGRRPEPEEAWLACGRADQERLPGR